MKNWKLSVKLIMSFVVVALITLIVGIIGWISVGKLSGDLSEVGEVRLPGVQSLLMLKETGETIRVAQRSLLNPQMSMEDRERQYANISKCRDEYQKPWKKYEGLRKTAQEEDLWKQFVPAWNEWRAANNEFVKLSKDLDSSGILNPLALSKDLQIFTKDHYKLMNEVLLMIASGRQFEGGEDHEKCNFGRWMSAVNSVNPSIKDALSKASSPHARFHQAVSAIKTFMKNGKAEDANSHFNAVMLPASEEVFVRFGELAGEAGRVSELYAKMNEQSMKTAREKQLVAFGLLDKMIKVNGDNAEETSRSASEHASGARIFMAIAMFSGFASALGLGIFLGLSISKALSRVINGLSEGAGQVAAAAGQVSGASQSLAEGASEQAASLEETSSSLEEMSSMTKRNAENSLQADALMRETNSVVEKAAVSMGKLTKSMAEIAEASSQTQKIIKNIDEIAFQTNLLALNAAVEAARAGEAGAGFAVVAEEVRNLALRSAEAAKNTASMIEGTVKKVGDGTSLLDQANKAFEEVSGSATKVGDLVSEISAASDEQAKGIELINRAVTEMDKITQQNAANAEESASASEELSAQSEQMLAFVDQLVELVNGAEGSGHSVTGIIPRRPRQAKLQVSAHKYSDVRSKKMAPALTNRARAVRSEKVLPLNDDNFSEF